METNYGTLPKIRTYTKIIYDYKKKDKKEIKEVLDLEVKTLQWLNEGYVYHSTYRVEPDKTGGIKYEINFIKQ
jgi:hypothetical protein